MGVEYYIIKPSTKEIFHLGKDMWYGLEGISQRKPSFVSWDMYEDVACDILKAHCYVSDDTMAYIMSLSYAIYEFCEYENVRLANDCEENTEWLEWKEVESIYNISSEIYGG